jgi:hypothetical protein|tara:strand:- start:4524 stop:4670 length:147 start_codon:yes stop_codon:yes gene_type:complete
LCEKTLSNTGVSVQEIINVYKKVGKSMTENKVRKYLLDAAEELRQQSL